MKRNLSCLSNSILIALLMMLVLCAGRENCFAEDDLQSLAQNTVERIRREALRSNSDPAGRPLPLAVNGNTGRHPNSAPAWSPARQIQLIEEGHFLLPKFTHPNYRYQGTYLSDEYFEEPLKAARRYSLPISFAATQWERILGESPFTELPGDMNPNVITVDGDVIKRLSPFGPIDLWNTVGQVWTDDVELDKLKAIYPEPPLIQFRSNNEHPRLQWHKVMQSKRYQQKYAANTDQKLWKEVVVEGFIERYTALQEGMLTGLADNGAASPWQQNVKFVGYNAFGPKHMGRWSGWDKYATVVPGRIDSNPLMWDGGCTSFYANDWSAITDYKVYSPQIEAMNSVFMYDQALKLNPEFWFEMAVWDGNDGALRVKEYGFLSKPDQYRALGQTYNPERYRGYVQFGTWLLRPRAVWEYRGWSFDAEEGWPYYLEILNSVDRVHCDPVLRKFWRYGKLVPNLNGQHPYQDHIPDEYKNVQRWFLLDADVNIKNEDMQLDSEIVVFSLALKMEEAGDKKWLLYGHAPLGDIKNVGITVPGYGNVQVDISRGGSFYVLSENSDKIVPLDFPASCADDCGTDVDRDFDGTVDCADQCPDDKDKIAPGECGCNVPEEECSKSGDITKNHAPTVNKYYFISFDENYRNIKYHDTSLHLHSIPKGHYILPLVFFGDEDEDQLTLQVFWAYATRLYPVSSLPGYVGHYARSSKATAAASLFIQAQQAGVFSIVFFAQDSFGSTVRQSALFQVVTEDLPN